MNDVDVRIARLKWRCRRGMRELDAVLQAFVEAEAARLSEAEMACFEAILELPDPTLSAYLLRRSVATDEATAVLLERIRASLSPSA